MMPGSQPFLADSTPSPLPCRKAPAPNIQRFVQISDGERDRGPTPPPHTNPIDLRQIWKCSFPPPTGTLFVHHGVCPPISNPPPPLVDPPGPPTPNRISQHPGGLLPGGRGGGLFIGVGGGHGPIPCPPAGNSSAGETLDPCSPPHLNNKPPPKKGLHQKNKHHPPRSAAARRGRVPGVRIGALSVLGAAANASLQDALRRHLWTFADGYWGQGPRYPPSW